MQPQDVTRNVRTLFEGEGYTLRATSVTLHSGMRAEVQPDGHVISYHGPEERRCHPGKPRGQEIAYHGDYPVMEAAYNLAISELRDSYKDGGIFSTGVDWTTVWTRDTAYATHLGLAMVDAEACARTLLHRVAINGEVEQDTGTGGSWPISTDRVSWGVAAWEIYLMTGDSEWLESSCRILEETCLHDDVIAADLTGLIRGETSFLDWREQSYPDWMTPSDIGESVAFSTMVLHWKAREILSRMYDELDKPERRNYWSREADRLRELIHELFWMPYHGLYGQYLYGRGFPVLSERIDTIGQSLAVVLEMSDSHTARGVVEAMPRYPLGVPCFHPMKAGGMAAYHNEGYWPLVESYYVLAAGRVRNENAVMAGLSALVRTALVCGTNKENVHILTGTPAGMSMSCDRQLWSIAGMLGVFYKVLFGLTPHTGGMELRPLIPSALEGEHRLEGINYRGMVLDIRIRGCGGRIAHCEVNGERTEPFIPGDLTGHVNVVIELKSDSADKERHRVNWCAPAYDLPMPQWDARGNDLTWLPVDGADYYRVYRNGIPISQTEGMTFQPLYPASLSHYQIMAIGHDGRESFLNEPREYVPSDARIETRPCGLAGDDVWVSRIDDSDKAAFYDVTINKPGVYRVDAFFANATGSLRDGNTCALRSLMLNGERAGSLVFPHLGEAGQWDCFGYSPGLDLVLSAGTYKVELTYQAHDENTNHFVNDSLIKGLRFTRIND